MNTPLHFLPAINKPDLISSCVYTLLKNDQGLFHAEGILVAEIDPHYAGGTDFCKRYSITENEGANCVIVEGIRNDKHTLAACVALVGYQMNFNGIIRKTLNARRVSVAPLPLVLHESKMEYGSITPFGLPAHWPILLDSRILNTPRIVIGSGLIKSKLFLPSGTLANLPGAIVIEGLASKKD